VPTLGNRTDKNATRAGGNSNCTEPTREGGTDFARLRRSDLSPFPEPKPRGGFKIVLSAKVGEQRLFWGVKKGVFSIIIKINIINKK